jgi:cell division protein FtsI (penicillin-binding protein 3)
MTNQSVANKRAAKSGGWRRVVAEMFSTRLSASGSRIRIAALGFAALYAVICGKLIYLGVRPESGAGQREVAQAVSASRPDIVDRNGDVLASDVKVMSAFAEPKKLIDADEAADQLSAILPDIDARDLRERLSMKKKGFIWVKREVTSQQRDAIFHLGLPGVGLIAENKRVYPNGPIGAHVLGFANIDNAGIAGIEKYIDGQGLADLHKMGFGGKPEDLTPVALSLDIRATHALRDELVKGIEHFRAKAGASAIMDVNTGEIIAMASWPDYDPNTPTDALDLQHINRMNVGVYEMGSTFKALTIAMALDSGKVNLNSRLDARGALSFGRFKIHDFHAQNRALTVPEVFTYSSNIGTARMAMGQGVEKHKAFLRKMGQLTRMRTELPESAEPIVPRNWGELNTMTIAFGHGLAVAPLQSMMAVGALMNGGYLIRPTFIRRSEEEARAGAERVISPETSEAMRYLMRLNAEIGTAKKVDIDGYFVGGKTGTAEKVIGGRYNKNRLFTTFMAVAPADRPRYLFLTLMDEPQGLPETGGYATAAYNAGHVTGRIIERVGPILGLAPRFEPPHEPFPLLAKLGYGMANVPATGGHGH